MTKESVFDSQKSFEAAELGMSVAIKSANKKHNEWQEKAFDFLVKYVKSHRKGHRFMIEEVRRHAELSGEVPMPPSKRAWGPIARVAQTMGYIEKKYIKSVSNVDAHSANAGVWECIYKKTKNTSK